MLILSDLLYVQEVFFSNLLFEMGQDFLDRRFYLPFQQ